MSYTFSYAALPDERSMRGVTFAAKTGAGRPVARRWGGRQRHARPIQPPRVQPAVLRRRVQRRS